MRKSKIFVIVVALFLLSVATTYGLVDAYEANAKSQPLTETQLQTETQNNLTNNGSKETAEAVKEFIQLKKMIANSKKDVTDPSENAPAEDEAKEQGGSEPVIESQQKVTTNRQNETYNVAASNKSDEAAAEKAAAEKAAEEQAAAEKAAAEKAAAEKAAAEKAAEEQAAAEKAAAEKAAAEKAAKPTKADGTPNPAYIDQMFSLINQERAAAGKSPLKLDAALCNAAQLKAEDMMKNNYFAHQSPTYGSAFEMMDYLGIRYRTAAENIAYGYRTPEGCMKGFMNSPGHKCNILDEKGYGYTKVGIGYAITDDGMTYWSQLFCG